MVSIPLVHKGEFRAYYLVPVKISGSKDKLVTIKTTKSILCVDNIRQYYYFSSETELQKYKEPTNHRYVSRQYKLSYMTNDFYYNYIN